MDRLLQPIPNGAGDRPSPGNTKYREILHENRTNNNKQTTVKIHRKHKTNMGGNTMVKVKGVTMVTVRGKKKNYIVIENFSEQEILTVSEKQYNKITKLIENATKHSNTLEQQQ